MTAPDRPDLAEPHRARLGLPGLAVVLLGPGGARVDTAGTADLGTGEPLRPDTPLRWYSLTKPVLAAAVLAAAEEGRVALARPVGEALPEWRVDASPRRAAVSAHDLLTHASGLRDRQFHAASWFLAPDEPVPGSDGALAAALRRRRRLARGGFHYSNLGYATLGRLLEVVDRASLEDVLRRRLLGPWGAASTRLNARAFPVDGQPPLARGHLRRAGVMAWALRGLTGRRFFAGRVGAHHRLRPRELLFPAHGGLVGPATDLAKVLAGLLGRGEGPLLSEAVRVLQATPAAACCGRGGARADEQVTPGFCRLPSAPEAPDEPVLFHGGRGPGFTAELRLLPGRDVAVGVVGNVDFDARGLAVQVLREALASGEI